MMVFSLVGIIFATLLGTVVGVAGLSSNWLVSRIALAFIEIHRNIPLLVLLFLWYRGIFTKLPAVRSSIVWPGPVYLNQRGLYMAWPRLAPGGWIFIAALLVGFFLAAGIWWLLRRLQESRGRPTYYALAGLFVLVSIPVIGWFVSGGAPLALDIPVLSGFNFKGGIYLSPEFAALLVGLVTYTAAFIAEVVRAGIQSVNRGQGDAAKALGLNALQILNLVILPQALRVIIPPLISQYLNLIKNSSLAIFIGFPELFFIGKTTTNQAGRAVQVFLLVMAVYLGISLVTSFLLNAYNRRIQLVER
jgi:general L-amino acid transport system permease protein